MPANPAPPLAPAALPEWVQERIAIARHDPCGKENSMRPYQRALVYLADALAQAQRDRDAYWQGLEDAVQWVGVVRDELVIAGYPGGDRTVALENIRALIAYRATRPTPDQPRDKA